MLPRAIGLSDVQTAGALLGPVVRKTPILTSRTLDARAGCRVFVKCENFQRGGSFKLRGAYNRLKSLGQVQRRSGVVSGSSGNHAQGVALAAGLLGIPATILMPTDAAASKRAATQAYGARIINYDRRRQNRDKLMEDLASERGFTVVSAFDDPQVMAGQGTVALELLSQVNDLDVLITPLGGGGLLSGCATVVKELSPRTQVIGVEPERGDDWVQSLAADCRVEIPPPTTIADGAQTQCPGEYTFPVVRELVDEVTVVSEEEIRTATRFLLHRMKLLVEPTGALGLALILSGRLPLSKSARVGLVASGGNVDTQRLVEILQDS